MRRPILIVSTLLVFAPDPTWASEAAHPYHRIFAPLLFTLGFLAGPVIFIGVWAGAFGLIAKGAFQLYKKQVGQDWDTSLVVAAGISALLFLLTSNPINAIGAFIAVAFLFRCWHMVLTLMRAKNFPKFRLAGLLSFIASAYIAVLMLPVFGEAPLYASTFWKEPHDPPKPHNKKPIRRQMLAAQLKFPNARSCLHNDPERPLSIDFAQVRNQDEAEVCFYRVLKEAGNTRASRAVLEAQNLTISDTFSPEAPYKGRHSNTVVSASWSVREKGPLFPETGVLARILNSVPYRTGITANYSADGEVCLSVRISSSTL